MIKKFFPTKNLEKKVEKEIFTTIAGVFNTAFKMAVLHALFMWVSLELFGQLRLKVGRGMPAYSSSVAYKSQYGLSFAAPALMPLCEQVTLTLLSALLGVVPVREALKRAQTIS